MFSLQINSIESQIQSLTEKLNQYRTLENQVESVKEALNQIEQTAQGLDPEVMPQVLASLGLPTVNSQTSQQTEKLEQQSSEQLEQAKEQVQQAQAQVIAQQEEITTLKQKLLVQYGGNTPIVYNAV